jgi:hypothetical protein
MALTHFQTFVDSFTTLDKDARRLAGDYILCPPSEDYGYQSTPKNSLTFAAMGVDGVHYAILRICGHVRDDSPVVYVSPMDSRDVAVLAESFLAFLANGCGVPLRKMQAVFGAERSGKRKLVPFLSKHFDFDRLLGEERTEPLTVKYGHLIEPKPESL